MPTASPSARSSSPFARAGRALRTSVTEPRVALRRVAARGPIGAARVRRVVDAVQAERTDAPPVVLAPEDAVAENGFTVFRGLFPPDECADLARRFKVEAGITDGVEHTRVDSTNKFATSRAVLFDERVVGAVRRTLGSEARFLQVSDLHYLHDTAGWHRDSVHREHDSSGAPDWNPERGRYGIVKAILYLESDNAAMGLMAGSHRSPIEIDREFVKRIETAGGQLVVDVDDEPNRRLSAAEKRVPVAWKARAGDVLVFDQRLYHAGRRVDGGRVSTEREAAKLTLSLVFGSDNMHSERMWSYFRFARTELAFRDYSPELRANLAEHELLLSSGLRNYYLDHPDELRLAHLRDPSKLDELVERFRREG